MTYTAHTVMRMQKSSGWPRRRDRAGRNGELDWMAGLREKLAAKMQLYREEFAKQTN